MLVLVVWVAGSRSRPPSTENSVESSREEMEEAPRRCCCCWAEEEEEAWWMIHEEGMCGFGFGGGWLGKKGLTIACWRDDSCSFLSWWWCLCVGGWVGWLVCLVWVA